MKHIPSVLFSCLSAILLTAAAPAVLATPPRTGAPLRAPQESENQGHHQSGIVGSVSGGVIIATPTGEGSQVRPDVVRVYTAAFPHELAAEVETQVQGNDWWHFEVYLKPGDYLVAAYTLPVSEGLFTYPVTVTVEKHELTQVPALVFVPQ
jgi:hypothetical protein